MIDDIGVVSIRNCLKNYLMKGNTIRDTAKEIGINRHTLSFFIQEKHKPHLKVFLKLERWVNENSKYKKDSNNKKD